MRLGSEYVIKVDEDMAEIMESITYIHSWIRNQALFKTRIEEDDTDEDVVIRLTSTDPQRIQKIMRFNYSTMDYENVKLIYAESVSMKKMLDAEYNEVMSPQDLEKSIRSSSVKITFNNSVSFLNDKVNNAAPTK